MFIIYLDKNNENETIWTDETNMNKQGHIFIYTGIIIDGVGREEIIFISFPFVVRVNCDFDRRVAGALLTLREIFVLFVVVRDFERLSSIGIVMSRFISSRVLLLRIESSYDVSKSIKSSCVIKLPFNNSSYTL
jgi:hypothetical protein